MKKYFGFIDESGVLDEAAERQPFFAIGMVKIQDTSQISESLMQQHYDFFSVQKDKRNALKRDFVSSIWGTVQKAKRNFVHHIIQKMDIPLGKNNNGLPFAQHITINKPVYFNVWPLKLSSIKRNGGV